MNKKILTVIIISALAAVYIVLSAAGLAGIENGDGGFIYRMVVIAALLFTCSRVFTKVVRSGDRGALLTASLGMGTLAVNEIYVFAYCYLLKGDAADITVANYSRNCAYLFFIAAVLILLPGLGKTLRNLIGILAAAVICMIFYGVITGSPEWLYYPTLALALLSVLLAAALLSAGNRESKVFAGALLIISVLDSLNRLLILLEPVWHWRDMVLSLYPAAYLLLGSALLYLQTENGKKTEVS